MKDLEKLMMAKKAEKPEMSDKQIQAKMDVLMELMELAKSEMGKKVKSGMDEMQKVTVAAPDAESLEKGLETAQELVPQMEEASEEAEEMSEEEETPEQEESEVKMAMSDLLGNKKEETPEEEEDDSIFALKRPKSKTQKLAMD